MKRELVMVIMKVRRRRVVVRTAIMMVVMTMTIANIN